MICQETRELMDAHLSLPSNDLRRHRLQKHSESCSNCAEQYGVWKASASWLELPTDVQEETPHLSSKDWFSNHVMARIYQEEAWRIPLAERKFSMSYARKMQVMVAMAVCCALFIIGMFHTVVLAQNAPHNPVAESGVFELLPVAGSVDVVENNEMLTATASIREVHEPLHFRWGPMNTTANLGLVLSILGLAISLLTISWLSNWKASTSRLITDNKPHY